MFLVVEGKQVHFCLVDVFLVVDIFYGGESVSSDQHQSYTCPHCGRLGFTDLLLLEHVGNEHADATAEVVIFSFHLFQFIVRETYALLSLACFSEVVKLIAQSNRLTRTCRMH